MAEAVMCFVIYLIVALVMIGIGVSQLRSGTPVGFYSGEKVFEAKELSDVSMWNKKHGEMWIIYGIIIVLSGFTGTFLIGRETVWQLILIPMAGGVIAPLVWMIWYHERLIRKYKLSE
ncbi:MAG: hypothetical protein K2O15_11735 [Lachnospiraceae bacterium]|nr:hypothetical protein [Lachnospiraceae bacterium]